MNKYELVERRIVLLFIKIPFPEESSSEAMFCFIELEGKSIAMAFASVESLHCPSGSSNFPF